MNSVVDKITDCFRDAERNYDCRTTDDVVPIQEKIEAFVLDAVVDLTPGFPYPVVNTCIAGKEKALAEFTSDRLGCFEDAFRRDPGAVDATCFDRPEARYVYAWDKLEGNGGCVTFDDDAALAVKSDAFIADIVAALDPQ